MHDDREMNADDSIRIGWHAFTCHATYFELAALVTVCSQLCPLSIRAASLYSGLGAATFWGTAARGGKVEMRKEFYAGFGCCRRRARDGKQHVMITIDLAMMGFELI